MNFKTLAIAATAMMVVAGGASAATVDFNVAKNYSTLGHTYGGVVHVTGGTVDTNGKIKTNNEKVASWTGNAGLGICSASQCNASSSSNEKSYRDQHTIDGKNKDEIALLDFGTLDVQIDSVTFTYWDSGDKFDYASFSSLTVGSTPVVWDKNNSASGNSSTKTFNFADGVLTGSLFGFGTNSSGDEFKLRAIAYTVLPPSSQVPLPAGGLLLISALGAMGVARRRRAQA